MVGMTLLNRKGYFSQHLDSQGNQVENPVYWKRLIFWSRWSAGLL
jgi:glucan phosphorylase